jgi:hypothetical protein
MRTEKSIDATEENIKIYIKDELIVTCAQYERAGISEATLNSVFESKVKPMLETFVKLAEASGHELILRIKKEEL